MLDNQGASIKKSSERIVYLIFSADSLFEGAFPVLDILEAEQGKASFRIGAITVHPGNG
ncbi:MAG: hypothetical protein LIP05_06220 [Tannerellaceae bacterium]|nr:hypothetical protein [Tannerellaceae bacterium]